MSPEMQEPEVLAGGPGAEPPVFSQAALAILRYWVSKNSV
jgi:hypothetical protein